MILQERMIVEISNISIAKASVVKRWLQIEDKILRTEVSKDFFVKSYNNDKKSYEVLAMFHKEKPDYNRCQYGFYTIDELVPKDHFLRQLEAEVDFDFIYSIFIKDFCLL